MLFNRLPFRIPFMAPEAAAGDPPAASAAPADPPASSEEDAGDPPAPPATPAKRGKKAAAPADPPAGDPPAPPATPAQSDLQAMAKLHAKIEALEEKIASGTAENTKAAELVASYKTFAVGQAKKALESAPKFTQDRVQINEADPLATIQQIELYNAVYAEAKAAAATEQPPAGQTPGSAPPPAAGSPAPKRVSVWDQAPPPGPISTRGRTKR